MDSKKTHNKYCKFLKGKRVALVGPGWHTKGTKQKKFIDSHDVVIRMNSGCKRPSDKIVEDIGEKMDVLYCALSVHYFIADIITSENLRKMKKKGLKWVSSPFSKDRRGGEKEFMKRNKCGINFHRVNKNYHDQVAENVNSLRKRKTYFEKRMKVSTGMMTIYDLLQYDLKSLYITGISFFDAKIIGKRKTYYSNYNAACRGLKPFSYSDPNKNIHNYVGEILFFNDLTKSDKRISYDDTLKKIIEHYVNRYKKS